MPQYLGTGTKDRDRKQNWSQQATVHMIPIHELLNRIRWDPEFAKGNLELGYYDRTENRIIMVSLKEVTFPTESPPPSNWWTRKVSCTVYPFIACAKFTKMRNGFGAGRIPVLLKPDELWPFLKAIANLCSNN